MRGGFFFFISEAARTLRINPAGAILTAITIALSLAIVTFAFLVFANLREMVSRWAGGTSIVVYVKDSADKNPAALKRSLLAIKGIRSAEYISREAALEELKSSLGDQGAVLEGIDSSVLPASFEIGLDPALAAGQGMPEVVRKIKRLRWVDDVQYSREWMRRFSGILGFIEFAAFFVGAFLTGAAIFIVTNTIRLALYARRKEIEVLKLVGATDLFIRIPFFIEGAVEGLAGGVLAVAMVTGARALLLARMPSYLHFIVRMPVSSYLLAAAVTAAGLVMGSVGSLLSTGRFLRS